MGGRLSYGVPFGKTGTQVDVDVLEHADELRDVIAGALRWDLDVGARIQRRTFVGGYAGVALGVPGGSFEPTCNAGDCALAGMRFGLHGQYHFASTWSDPWIGAGVGLELLSASSEPRATQAEETVSLTGLECLNLQAGLDVPLRTNAAFGPFSTFGIGRFSSGRYACRGADCDTESFDFDLANANTHYWLTFGLRVTYLP